MKKYKKYAKKLTALTCAVIMLFALAVPANAIAGTRTKLLSSNSQYSDNAKMTTTYVASRVYPHTSTQALHTKGVETTISVSHSISTTCAASSTLITEYSDIFIKFAQQLEVSNSQSLTITSGVSYTIPASTASGRYRVETVFPALKVYECIYRNGPTGTAILFERTVTYAPEIGSQYYRLQRYAGA